MKLIAVIAVLMSCLLMGCASSTSKSIRAYNEVKDEIELGQTKVEVLALLRTSLSKLQSRQSRQSEAFEYEGKTREIVFGRSRQFNDGLVTDDEFTPYTFDNGVLVGIGWTAIGGPKTQAQARDQHSDFFFGGPFFGSGFFHNGNFIRYRFGGVIW